MRKTLKLLPRSYIQMVVEVAILEINLCINHAKLIKAQMKS